MFTYLVITSLEIVHSYNNNLTTKQINTCGPDNIGKIILETFFFLWNSVDTDIKHKYHMILGEEWHNIRKGI